MGTAGQWKSLMLAWSYENNLAIPPFGEVSLLLEVFHVFLK
jgi:hypothetical protein